MDIGLRIKSLRMDSGLTQVQLSKALYVSRQTILNWEQGRTTPDAQSLLMMGVLFGVPVDALLCGDAETTRAIVCSDRRRKRRYTLCSIAIGFAGSALLVHPLIASLGIPLGCIAALTPLACTAASSLLFHRGARNKEVLELPRASSAPAGSLTLKLSGHGDKTVAVVNGKPGEAPFTVEHGTPVPRGANWTIRAASGRAVATVSLRNIVVGTPCPVIKTRIEGFGTVKLEKRLEQAGLYRNIWRIDGGDLAVEGDWLGPQVTVKRGGSALVRVLTLPKSKVASSCKRTYRVEHEGGMTVGAVLTLGFMFALVRDIESQAGGREATE